jgi:hypothetical protein
MQRTMGSRPTVVDWDVRTPWMAPEPAASATAECRKECLLQRNEVSQHHRWDLFGACGHQMYSRQFLEVFSLGWSKEIGDVNDER